VVIHTAAMYYVAKYRYNLRGNSDRVPRRPVLGRVGLIAKDDEVTPAVQYEILLFSVGDFL
jgi:hypothetical protein